MADLFALQLGLHLNHQGGSAKEETVPPNGSAVPEGYQNELSQLRAALEQVRLLFRWSFTTVVSLPPKKGRHGKTASALRFACRRTHLRYLNPFTRS